MKKSCQQLFLITLLFFLLFTPAYAGPLSTNYEIKEYSFGGGGTTGSSSTNYKAFGVLGELEYSQPGSTNYKVNGGLTYMMQANVPAAPTLSNPGSNTFYDRLKLVLSVGTDPSDTLYEVTFTDGVTTFYVQSDFTVTTTSANAAWLGYSTGSPNWGGASGQIISNLKDSTAYTANVKAKKGNYTESIFGPASASVSTSAPSLSYGLSSSTLTFSNLNPSNSFTDSSKTTIITTTTNAHNGYVAYGRETGVLANGSANIPDFTAGTNATPVAWSGIGFGYSTSAYARFSGPKYAAFLTTNPGDQIADNAGPVITAPINDTTTISYRVTAQGGTPAGSYTTTIIYSVVPTY